MSNFLDSIKGLLGGRGKSAAPGKERPPTASTAGARTASGQKPSQAGRRPGQKAASGGDGGKPRAQARPSGDDAPAFGAPVSEIPPADPGKGRAKPAALQPEAQAPGPIGTGQPEMLPAVIAPKTDLARQRTVTGFSKVEADEDKIVELLSFKGQVLTAFGGPVEATDQQRIMTAYLSNGVLLVNKNEPLHPGIMQLKQ